MAAVALAHLLERAISKQMPVVDARIARRYARLLQRPIGLGGVVVELSRGFRLRLLDKRVDLLTYLRFADVSARSCFRSDSGLYHYGGTRDQTIDAWKDPLTLAFHVERERDGVYLPRGFLFGSLAELDGRPVAVFNSLHVRPRTAELRERVIRAVEQVLRDALGITRLGIANVHGGRGPLPGDYAIRSVELTRYRALARNGLPVSEVWDDISLDLNRRIVVPDLYWRS